MTSSYICVTYGYSLRWYEVFRVDLQRLIYGIRLEKYDRSYPQALVEVLVRFKGDDGNIIHLLTLVSET